MKAETFLAGTFNFQLDEIEFFRNETKIQINIFTLSFKDELYFQTIMKRKFK